MQFLMFIQVAAPRFAGEVSTVHPDGFAFLKSDCRLPMTNGSFTDEFFIPPKEASGLEEGVSVTFRWRNPGQPGTNPATKQAGLPVAYDVHRVERSVREAVSGELRAREAWMRDLDKLLEADHDVDAMQEEVRGIFSDPETSVSAAIAVYYRARKLVRNQAVAEENFAALQHASRSLDYQLADVRKLQAELSADEQRLAPLRSFAASVGFDESPVVPQVPDTPSAELSLEALDVALAPLSSDFARRTTLVALLTAAVKGRLLLLDGPVGTGKSSLAERIAVVCGGQCEVIPVRPAWVEPSDLLGFFDPMSRVFRPGPFTDAVAHPLIDRLNVVVLDEMNLARVENYSADILSRVERIAESYQAGTTPKGIPTWSTAEWRALKAEWEILASQDVLSPDAAHRISQLRHTFQYNPLLTPSDGVVLVGTLNTDDTTYNISPKVIDRSFAIAFPPAALSTVETLSAGQCHGLSVRELRSFVAEHRHASHDSLWRKLLQTIGEETMASLGIPYSYRVVTDFDCFTTIGGYLEVAEDELLPMFVFSRVLPRVRFFKDEKRTEALQSALDRIRELRTGQSDRAWDGLIDRLESQCRNEQVRVVRFWHGDSA